MIISVIIRTLNESKYLDDLILSIRNQVCDFEVETVIVDSGSTDGTLDIAKKHDCVITHIMRENFSFGRSLNLGCEIAKGDILVFISGHCIPQSFYWLQNLCSPIQAGQVNYSYGKQLGGENTFFSESRIFAKYFPNTSNIPQNDYFCNNANSALSKHSWLKYRFDESVTGLEDMELGQRLFRDGGHIGYVSEAPVYHYHNETWPQVRRRFEREAIALQKIKPNIHISFLDTVRYIALSILHDFIEAKKQKRLKVHLVKIIAYRYNQYIGSFIGNRIHRKLSSKEKEKYFYPTFL